ncbi:MAG: hypothetical protein ACREO9_06205, partial [Lysobacterales bacterium]
MLLAVPGLLYAQVQAAGSDSAAPAVNTAPVIIDGEQLFSLRGATSFPAAERAGLVRQRIIDIARDTSIAPEAISITELPDRTQIIAGETVLVTVFDLDAEVEGMSRQLAAALYQKIISTAIAQYRTDRSVPVLLRHSGFALAATLLMALLLWCILRFSRWVNGLAERHVQK